MRCFMVTNGVLLEKYACEIVESKLDYLQISIDAPGIEHDKIRNRSGLFMQIFKGIKKINDIKRVFPFISTATVLMPQNVNQLDILADEVMKMGVGKMFFQLLMAYKKETIIKYKTMLVEKYGFNAEKITYIDSFEGDGITYEDYCLGSEKLLMAKRNYNENIIYPDIFNSDGYMYYRMDEGEIPPKITNGCWSIKYKINIQPSGDVVLCPDFPDFVLGNVFKQSIIEIWNSKKRKLFLKNYLEGKPLPICFQCCQLWDKEDFGSWKGTK